MNKTKVYDIGEEEIIKHQLHALLIKDILLTQFSKNNYLKDLSKKIANQSLV